MGQWTAPALVQIIACRFAGAKSLSKPMLGYSQLDPYEQISVKFWFKKSNIFIQEKAFESAVCEMAASLSSWGMS